MVNVVSAALGHSAKDGGKTLLAVYAHDLDGAAKMFLGNLAFGKPGTASVQPSLDTWFKPAHRPGGVLDHMDMDRSKGLGV